MNEQQGPHRTGPKMARTKVKSGCRTCKKRKVKCDEGRPACHRCMSTGRTCDGYGVWGGGGRPPAWGPIATRKPTVIRRSLPISALITSDTEQTCFEWFAERTLVKLPGLFKTGFWDSLIFQASMTEPSVLHAVLAFSSHHRTAARDGINWGRARGDPDEQERFMLRQYSTAIAHVRPILTRDDRDSARVALITCATFTFLEMLRGHFKAGETHLRNGLKLLGGKFWTAQGASHDGALVVKPKAGSVDEWITQLFRGLQVQSGMLGASHWPSPAPLYDVGSEGQLYDFTTVHQARNSLHCLIYSVLDISDRCRRLAREGQSTRVVELFHEAQRLNGELACWLGAYRTTTTTDNNPQETFAYHVLSLLHSMASIMLRVSLCPGNESAYDSEMDLFASMIARATEMRGLIASIQGLHYECDRSHSMVDFAWIPPLYLVATKCRNHRLRLQAVRLLETTQHREGIWDSKIASHIGRKVMEIEEGSFLPLDVYANDEDDVYGPVEDWGLSHKLLPESRRVHDLDVDLPEDPAGRVVMKGSLRDDQAVERAFVKMYDLARQWWVDVDVFEAR